MRHISLIGCLASSLMLSASSIAARAEEPPREIAGPVAAHVVKVRDGDTIEVEAFIWPMQSVHVAVRLRGIDAPEKRGGCEAEKAAADVATARLVELIGSGPITLTEISGDKYFGRVLATVGTSSSVDVGRALLSEGLVVSYGGKARIDWCAELSGTPIPSFAPRG